MSGRKRLYTKILKKAIATAYAGACSHVITSRSYSHHCAVIIHGGNIISVGQNAHGIHAEAAAISNAAGSEIYAIIVLRVYADGHFGLANSMPCVDCTRLIKKTGIRHIFYSDENGNIVHRSAETFISDFVTLKNRMLDKVIQ